MTQLDELITDLNKATDLQRKIQSTENEIEKLVNKSRDKIDKLVYACSTVEELSELCDAFGLDNKGYRWGWKEAYKNSFEEDTDYEKTEWSDILYHVAIDLRLFVEKKAKEKWRKDNGMN